ncbi:PREDICTED: inner centromere protein-like [Poecilia mexicana]|uniref:inner centromere protein-like n=1 Tax=Poecilia mexicana TaxID=48701 RepID=UPI00072EB4B7|nr:PREDICTED: inner centromere protein-like [Poecilia mexicana]
MTDKDHKELSAVSCTEVEENDAEQISEPQTVRRSERVRTLTEKGKELQEEKLKTLQHRYAVGFEKWRYEARLRSKSRRSKSSSSSSQTTKRLEAEAEAAASQEILTVMEEQEKETIELQKLERENLERQQAMEEQRRKIKRLEEIKIFNAAKARVKVYEEAESISASQSSSQSIKAESEIQAIPVTAHSSSPALNVTQFHYATSTGSVLQIPTVVNQTQQSPGEQPKATMSQTLKSSSPPFIPQATQVSFVAAQQQSNYELVGILAEAISANRLPTPEPTLFTGDPLKFKDWQLSFETLIERKKYPLKQT